MKKLGTYTKDGWKITISKTVSIAKHEATGEVVIASYGSDIEEAISLYMRKNPELFAE